MVIAAINGHLENSSKNRGSAFYVDSLTYNLKVFLPLQNQHVLLMEYGTKTEYVQNDS